MSWAITCCSLPAFEEAVTWLFILLISTSCLATTDDTPLTYAAAPLLAQAPAEPKTANLASDAGSGAKASIQGASQWSMRQWQQMIKAALSAYLDDYAGSMGAALSYYTVFSLAPLLVIVISVAGLVYGADAIRGELFAQINGLMGAEAAKGIQDLLSSVSKPSTGILGTVIGVVVLLIGATTVFGELQDALDRIWRAPARVKSRGLMTLVRTRVLSFSMILGIAFLLTVSLVTGAGIAALGKWWSGWFEGWELVAQIINIVVGFLMTTAAFALIYKLMPRVTVSWGDVWVGAAVTALLFTVGRFLISLYIGKIGVASGFGAAGSVVVIFVWVYYSAQIFLVGAEFTWVYAQYFGSRRKHTVPPGVDAPKATPISEKDAAALPAPIDRTKHRAQAGPDAKSASTAQHHPTMLVPALAATALGAAALLIARRYVSRRPRSALVMRNGD